MRDRPDADSEAEDTAEESEEHAEESEEQPGDPRDDESSEAEGDEAATPEDTPKHAVRRMACAPWCTVVVVVLVAVGGVLGWRYSAVARQAEDLRQQLGEAQRVAAGVASELVSLAEEHARVAQAQQASRNPATAATSLARAKSLADMARRLDREASGQQLEVMAKLIADVEAAFAE